MAVESLLPGVRVGNHDLDIVPDPIRQFYNGLDLDGGAGLYPGNVIAA